MSDFKTVCCTTTFNGVDNIKLMISGSYLTIYYIDNNGVFKTIDLEKPYTISLDSNTIPNAPPNPPVNIITKPL